MRKAGLIQGTVIEGTNSHNHNDIYYTETEIGNIISDYETISGAAGKYSVLGHTHSYAPISGSANYIQNQTSVAQNANFYITGEGRMNKASLYYNNTEKRGEVLAGNNALWLYTTGEYALNFGTNNSSRASMDKDGYMSFLYQVTAPTIKLTTGAGAGKVLVSDANGVSSWNTLADAGIATAGHNHNSAYAPISGSANYIQNQYSYAQSANMRISENGYFGGNLTGNIIYASNGLNVQAANYPVINFIKSNGTQHATIYSADYSLNLRVYDSGGNYATPLELTKGSANVVGTTGDVFSVTNSIGKYALNAYTWSTPSSHVLSIGSGGYYSVENGTTHTRLNTTGFGINNTDPQHALDVTGNIGIKGVGQKLYFDSLGYRNTHSIGIRDDYDLSFYNSRGQNSEFVLGNASVYLKTASTTRLYFDGATGTATFSSLAGAGTRIVTADTNGQLGSSTALNIIGNDYIQNQNSSAQNAYMWISGSIKSPSYNTYAGYVNLYNEGWLWFYSSDNSNAIRLNNSGTRVDFYNQTNNFYANVAVGQLQSAVATGTAPLTVQSTTLVSNLNSDLLDSFHLSEIVAYSSNRDFLNGTLITTNIDYSQSEGNAFYLKIYGNSYSSSPPFDLSVQGYIYNNTIINVSGKQHGYPITGIVAINYNGNLCFWFPRFSYWQGFRVECYIVTSGTPQKNRVVSITDEAKPTTNKEVNISQSVYTGYGSDNLRSNSENDSRYVQTQYNSSLNTDSRNSRGVTRLYRMDADGDYSVQVSYNSPYWHLRGYQGDTFYSEVRVGYSDVSASTNTINIIDNRGADRQPSYYSYGINAFFTNSIPESSGDWTSAITVRGWSDPNYNSWQLIGGSTTASRGKWWFREGISSFGTAYEIWHSGNLRSNSDNDSRYILNQNASAQTANMYISGAIQSSSVVISSATGLRIAPGGVNWDYYTDTNGNLCIANGNGNYVSFDKLTVKTTFSSSVGVGITPSYRVDIKAPDMAEVRIGGGSAADYINAAILFQNNGSQSHRGLGTFYLDTAGQHEWYVGTPYAYADSFMIGRRGSATGHSTSTAQTSYSFMRILNDSSISMGTDTPLGNTQLTVNLRSGGGGAAIAARYNGGTTDLGEAAFLAWRNSIWSNLYLSGSGASTTYGFYVDGTKPNYINSKLGIGAAPDSSTLRVQGLLKVETSDWEGSIRVNSNGTSYSSYGWYSSSAKVWSTYNNDSNNSLNISNAAGTVIQKYFQSGEVGIASLAGTGDRLIKVNLDGTLSANPLLGTNNIPKWNGSGLENSCITSSGNNLLFSGSGDWTAPTIFRTSNAQMAISDYNGVSFGGYNGVNYGQRVTIDGYGNMDILGTVRINNQPIYFRNGTDLYHAVAFDGTTDGPFMYGFRGAALGYTNGSTATRALYTYNDKVFIPSITFSTNRLIVMTPANGLSTIADGAAGKFLKTDGNGTYTWDTAGGSMVYPGATGLAYYNSSTGTWGTSITDNSTNWNSAYTFTNGFATNYPDLTAIEALTGTTGFLKKTAANTWALDTAVMTNPMVAVGDLVIGGTSGAPTRLAYQGYGYTLVSYNSNVVQWDLLWYKLNGNLYSTLGVDHKGPWASFDSSLYSGGSYSFTGNNNSSNAGLVTITNTDGINGLYVSTTKASGEIYGGRFYANTSANGIGLFGSGAKYGGYFIGTSSTALAVWAVSTSTSTTDMSAGVAGCAIAGTKGVGVVGQGTLFDLYAYHSGIISMKETSSPTNPYANYSNIYSNGGVLYIRNSGGTSTVVGTQTSDFWLKKDFRKLETPLEKILKLNAYSFNYQKEPAPFAPKDAISIMLTNDTGKRDASGVIAQEIEKLIPESVYTSDNGYKSVNYNQVVPYLIESIKELNNKIETLESKLSKYE